MTQAIRTRLQQLLHDAQRRLGLHTAEAPVQGDEADVAANYERREQSFADRSRLREQLADAQAALDRLDADEYGICIICDHPIAAARLKAIPQAARCIGCQERLEREAMPHARVIEEVESTA